jgi:MoaA/NifB/PqqE/SkfB family radical SAM enzyme
LAALWIQITGTWCNLECIHCLNASGPKDPWLAPLDAETVSRAIREAEAFSVKEIYFTGGEPFLHPAILTLLGEALEVAPTTVLTNGIRISEAVADALAEVAARTPYSLEIRVSLDDVDPEAIDRVRGQGAWEKAVAAIRRLDARGLLPIVTATEILMGGRGGTVGTSLRAEALARQVPYP